MLRLEGCHLIAERLHRSSLMKDEAMSEWNGFRIAPPTLSACGEKFIAP